MSKLDATGKSRPKKGTHAVSSFSIEVEEENLVAPAVQADPRAKIKSSMVVKRIDIDKPAFGNNWHLLIYKPKTIKPIWVKNLEAQDRKFSDVSDNENESRSGEKVMGY